MQRTTGATLALGLALLGASFVALGVRAEHGSQPIVTQYRSFRIPFHIGQAGDPARRPVEVQLFVSTDRGGQWRGAGVAKPDAGFFAFKAPSDGEYWFMVRTKDAAGALRPNTPPAPQLKVVVRSPASAPAASGAPTPAPQTAPAANSTLTPSHPRATGGAEVNRPSDTTGLQDPFGQPRKSTAWPPASEAARPIPPNSPAPPTNAQCYTPPSAFPAASSAGLAEPAANSPQTNPRQPGETYQPPMSAVGAGSPAPIRIPPRAASKPAAPRRRLAVNSRAFMLDYDLGTAASEAQTVELWGTTDGGAIWRRYTVDEDHQSPVFVQVEGEGEYGFRLVVYGRNGAVEFPPGRGDAPEMYITVDTTPPACHLVRAEQGEGPAPPTDALLASVRSAVGPQVGLVVPGSRGRRPLDADRRGPGKLGPARLANGRRLAEVVLLAAGGPRRRRQHRTLHHAGRHRARPARSARANPRRAAHSDHFARRPQGAGEPIGVAQTRFALNRGASHSPSPRGRSAALKFARPAQRGGLRRNLRKIGGSFLQIASAADRVEAPLSGWPFAAFRRRPSTMTRRRKRRKKVFLTLISVALLASPIARWVFPAPRAASRRAGGRRSSR